MNGISTKLLREYGNGQFHEILNTTVWSIETISGDCRGSIYNKSDNYTTAKANYHCCMHTRVLSKIFKKELKISKNIFSEYLG